MPDSPIIILSCGGTGVKVSERLLELMMEDAEWRTRAPHSVFFITVDTDIAEINRFQRSVPPVMKGNVVPFPLSEGVTNFEQVVEPILHRPFVDPSSGKKRLENAEAQQAFDKLFQHYWKKDGDDKVEPYMAGELMRAPITEGAGQRPSVSHTLAWRLLPNFERICHNLMETIQAKSLASFDRLSVYVVGSLAGGTGRGCWRLLTWKLRQVVAEDIHGVNASYLGFFFDSTIFQFLEERKKGQRLSMRVNTFTGLSEQSACMGGGLDPLRYRLPSWGPPADAASEDNDVLVAPRVGDGKFFRAVDKFFVISGTHSLPTKDPKPFYTLAGNALFTRLAYYRIRSADINEANRALMGVYCGTVEVAAQRLRLYFESVSRTVYLEQLLAVRPDRVQSGFNNVMRAMGLDLKPIYSMHDLQSDDKGNFMEQVLAKIESGARSDLVAQIAPDGGESELNIDEETAIDTIVEATQVDTSKVVEAIDDVLQGLDWEDRLEEVFAREVAGFVSEDGDASDADWRIREQEEKGPSAYRGPIRRIAEVGLVADRVLEVLFREKQGYFDKLPSADDLRGSREYPDLAGFIRSFRGKSRLVFGERYDAAERAEIFQEARRELFLNALDVLREEMPRRLRQRLQTLDGLSRRTRQFADALDGVRSIWNEELKKSIGVERTDEIFPKIFSDPENPQTYVDGMSDSATRFYRRSLKPPMTPAKVQQILLRFGDSMAFSVDEKATDDFLRKILFRTEEDIPGTSEIERHIRSAVALKTEFLRQEFSLVGVLSRIEAAFLEQLNRNLGDQDRLSALEMVYRQFFGDLPPRPNERFEPWPHFGILSRTALSMAAICRPTLNLRDVGGGADARTMTVLLPQTNVKGFNLAEANQAKGQVFGNSASVEILQPGAGEQGSTFAAFVYSSAGVKKLDDVASFDYWKSDPEVTRHLRLLEEGSTGMFSAGDLTGVGYVDPFFVKDEQARLARWRPWMPQGESVADREVLEALHYAFLSQTLSPEWPLPLIEEGRQRYFYLNRRSIDWRNGQPVERRDCPWLLRDDGKQTLGQGIDDVVERLAGEASTWRAEILAEAELFRREIALPAGCVPGSASYTQLLESQLDFIDEQRHKTSAESGQSSTWEKLYRFVQAKLHG